MRFLLAFALLLTTSAHAAGGAYGELVKAPATVKALSEETGQVEEYNITPVLNDVYAEGTTLSLSNNGVMAMCGTYYGQLAEDFSVVVKQKDGTEKTVTVRAASKDRKVSVFGMCQGDSRDLTQLQIDVQKGEPVEIR